MPNTPLPDHFYTQSGVIPYRRREGSLEVLLITSRRKKRWIIPKGVVEPEMTPAESAANEAWEEAGIRGKVKPKAVGTYTYHKWGGTCRVEVYVMAVTDVLSDWLEADFRTRRWFSLDQAAGRVDEVELKRILRNLPAWV